ncbi:MAG TPA: choice-of-anchor Q domain-containing protein, partial [Thermomicrobiaceae bacterium]|nr:choice-of-anchor Q domain-containing protein [Thermomicrobiaceae bacterium]
MGRLRIGTMVSLLVLGLLAGLAFISPAARAEGTQTFSDCPTEQTLQGYMDAGGMIQYTGSTPCTIPLTSSLMMSKEVNVEIDGGVGLTLNGGTSANHGNFMLIRISNTSPSTLTLNHVTLENGLSGIGEDIGNATVNLTNSTIQDMGLLDGTNAFGIDAMTATVTNSTIARISGATNISVGIWVDTLATVTNSTIAGVSSSVAGTEVVGIWSGGDATLTSSTISGVVNSGYAPLGTGIRTADTLNLTATILADSSGRNCAAGPGNTSVSDHGYNISANAAGNDTTCHLSGTSKQNVSDSQLNLQPLADNGGPTETQALVAPSVAIDAIPLNGSQCAAGEQADQRGVARPQGSGCDVGAYELI